MGSDFPPGGIRSCTTAEDVLCVTVNGICSGNWSGDADVANCTRTSVHVTTHLRYISVCIDCARVASTAISAGSLVTWITSRIFDSSRTSQNSSMAVQNHPLSMNADQYITTASSSHRARHGATNERWKLRREGPATARQTLPVMTVTPHRKHPRSSEHTHTHSRW